MIRKRIAELKLWKQKSIWIFTGFVLLAMLVLCVKLVAPCEEYEFEGSCVFEENVSTNQTVIYEGIALRPGVYRVELEYVTDTDAGALCSVQDGTVFTGGLLTNGEHLYEKLGKTGYDFWLYEQTQGLQVTVSYGGKGALTTGNLKIVETNQLWTMLLTILILGTAGVYTCLIFYYYNCKYPVSVDKKHVFFWITLIILGASLPYLYGYNITGADLTYHLQRIEGVKDGLFTGQFPVRLEPKWVFNHGYANGIFYCNTLLYLPALLRMLGFTVSASYNAYCICLNIATAWISYYCFSRIFKNDNIGILCSALYTLSIFRIYKLVVTCAVGEGSAVTFLPLVIYGLYRVFTENPKMPDYKSAWISIMLGYAGLLQTHVLTCEITAMVTLLICLIYIRKIFCWETFLELAKGAGFAVLLSLWYLVPFLDYYLTQDVHIRHVSARTIQESGLTPAHLLFHFWTTGDHTPSAGKGVQYSHPVGIGLVLIVGLIVFVALWFSGMEDHEKQDGLSEEKSSAKFFAFGRIIAVISVVLLFMSTNVFPWDKIQSLHPAAASLVSSLQFPNRFLGWGTTGLVLIFGYCLWYFGRENRRGYRIMAVVAAAGVVTSGMYLLDYVKRDQNYYELYNEESMGFGYISGAEYVLEGTDIEKLSFADVVPSAQVEVGGFEKEGLCANLICINNGETEGYVDVPMLFYKGYQATDLAGEFLRIAAGDNNVIRVYVPAGFQGEIEVRFVSPFYWRISEGITAVTILVLFIFAWSKWRKRRC